MRSEFDLLLEDLERLQRRKAEAAAKPAPKTASPPRVLRKSMSTFDLIRKKFGPNATLRINATRAELGLRSREETGAELLAKSIGLAEDELGSLIKAGKMTAIEAGVATFHVNQLKSRLAQMKVRPA